MTGNTYYHPCLTWLLSILATIPNFFVGSLQYEPRMYSCTFAQTVSSHYTISLIIINFLISVLVISFCYLGIWILVIKCWAPLNCTGLSVAMSPANLRL
ncbi:hypothetical protein Z043_126059, partial [Scleropages formosus]